MKNSDTMFVRMGRKCVEVRAQDHTYLFKPKPYYRIVSVSVHQVAVMHHKNCMYNHNISHHMWACSDVSASLTFSSLCVSDPHPPSIRLNSDFLPNQTEVVLNAGSTFNLSCHSNGSVHWSTTAFRLLYQDQLLDPVEVRRSDPRHTGTYRCGYTNQSLEHLDTWVHLYFTGE